MPQKSAAVLSEPKFGPPQSKIPGSAPAFMSTCLLLQRQPHVVFHVSARYIFCSIGMLQLVAATMCVLSAMPYPAALVFFCVISYMEYLPEYLPVWSCVYMNVLNCIHNQI